MKNPFQLVGESEMPDGALVKIYAKELNNTLPNGTPNTIGCLIHTITTKKQMFGLYTTRIENMVTVGGITIDQLARL